MRLAWPFTSVRLKTDDSAPTAVTVFDDGLDTMLQRHVMAYMSDGRRHRMVDIWYAMHEGPFPDLKTNIRHELVKLVKRGVLTEGWQQNRLGTELEFVYQFASDLIMEPTLSGIQRETRATVEDQRPS